MAAALDAEYCEICSDVDGVYSADPRVVSEAQRIATLSYEETQEMAEAGAKVLNAQAVEFAKEKGIAIYARATGGPLPGPDPSVDGTVVRAHPPRMPGTVVGVASERDVLLLESQAPASELLALLDECAVAGKQLHIVGERTSMIVSRENLHNETKLRATFDSRLKGQVRLVDGLAAVSVIGAGINATYRNVRSGSEALLEANIPSPGVATSSFRITWMIARERTDEAVRILHRRFIESAAESPASSR
jgi:aspartate kinase